MSRTPQDALAPADRELLAAYERVLSDLGAGHPTVLPDGAASIVRALAEVPSCAVLGPEVRCALCAEPHQHAETCPWQLARAWVLAHDGLESPVDPDVEPPLYDDGPGKEPWQRGAR